MEANASAARAGDYAVSITDTAYTGSSSQMGSGTTNCETAACSPSALAAYDLAQWTTRLTQSLILKEATVALVGGAPIEGTYTITIAWDEPRGRQTYADTNSKTERMSVTMTKVVRNG
jgi:hypothetical protein